MLFWLFLLVPSVLSGANTQCMCKDYEPCIEETDTSFYSCFMTCQKTIRKVPKPYIKCLKKLVGSLDKVHECTKTFVHDGCTVNKYNVAQVRYFDKFLNAGKERIAALAPKVELNLTFSDDDTLQFNECVARCFFIAENECTTELNCALNMPDEQQMLTNMRECVMEKDPRLFMNAMGCLSLVTEPFRKPKKAKEEYRAVKRRM